MPQALQGAITYAMATDTGRVRSNNEDAIGADDDLGLLVLADGMGGYKAGEVASGMTVASVIDTVRNQLPGLPDMQHAGDATHSPHAALLREAVETAHTSVYHVSRSQKQCEGMGTTAVVLLFRDDCIAVASVGDSRLYRVREGTMEQVTRDHSLVQELIDRGFYSADEAQTKVARNIVTRALGIEAEIEVDVIEEPTQSGDVYLLCSDGLSDLLSDDAIALTLNRFAANLDHAVEELIRQANEAGGKDNISVIAARVDRAFARRRGWMQRVLNWW